MKLENIETLRKKAAENAKSVGMPEAVLEKALGGNLTDDLNAADVFAALEWLIPRRDILMENHVADLIAALEGMLRLKAYAYPPPYRDGGPMPVVFGTGGHRGEIGVGLTLLHVHVIISALIESVTDMTPAERLLHYGAKTEEGVKERGFVLGHDNRLFNPEFSFYATSLLREAGYVVRYAGRVASPELSLLVPHLGWAGAINFTPSHNPFRYGGIKLNPVDGGLAGGDLTDPLALKANQELQSLKKKDWPKPDVLAERIQAESERIERVEVHEIYLDCLDAHPVVRLEGLIQEIKALPEEKRLLFVVDPVWGAAVPLYKALQNRMGRDVLQLIHTREDAYFGGQTTEPNEDTLIEVIQLLQDGKAAVKVGIRNDPDGDRGLVADDKGALKMNKYAALVMRYLMDLGQKGTLITTMPTSHFGPAYAIKHGSKVVLTPTGFKNFRPHLLDGQGLMAYEESDGMTIKGHTLDKDGILAGLMAVRMVLHYGKPLHTLLAEVEAELGAYHWHQETFNIEISAAEAREKLKKLTRIKPGKKIEVAGKSRKVKEVDTSDGYKFTLDDGSWMMMRPSGTEPKIRIYAETSTSSEDTRDLCEKAKAMAREVMGG